MEKIIVEIINRSTFVHPLIFLKVFNVDNYIDSFHILLPITMIDFGLFCYG